MPAPGVTGSPLSPLSRPTRALLALAFLAVLVRTAWLSDDALISLRSVLNVTHGFGLTFNIDERVQTFTHPLWVLLLTVAYLLAGNVYAAAFALSIGVSLAAFWVAVGRAASAAQAWLVVVLLLFSRAFVDFSTSGLENPLSNLLLALFVAAALRVRPDGRPRLTTLWLLASLLYLSRPDDVLFAAPTVLAATWRAGRLGTSLRAAAVGLAPAALWTIFAVLYYGFPLPNTAYAKLSHGIHPSEVWRQGLLYLGDSLDRDPLTLAAIAFSIVFGLRTRGVARGLAVGLGLYVGYVVSIGGDFMAGRFMAVPLYLSALVLGWLARADARSWMVSAGIFAALGLSSAQIPLLSDSRFDRTAVKPSGTVDERAVYFRTSSLMLASRQSFRDPAWPRADDPRPARRVLETCGLMGSAGLEWGPYTHLLDECGLADPLLARLPALFNRDWRVGHFRRMIPRGYRESLEADANRLADPGLARYYDRLRALTRSPSLITRARLAEIWRTNTGAYVDLVDRAFYRHGGALAPLAAFAAIVPDGTPADAPEVRRLAGPLAITCEPRPGRRHLDITLDSNDRYLLTFVLANRIVAEFELGPIPPHRRREGLAAFTEDLPLAAVREGFDTVIVAPMSGDEPYALGHLLLDGEAATGLELRRRVAERDRRAPR
jgi:arabinofuranosyltransferase